MGCSFFNCIGVIIDVMFMYVRILFYSSWELGVFPLSLPQPMQDVLLSLFSVPLPECCLGHVDLHSISVGRSVAGVQSLFYLVLSYPPEVSH